MNQLISLLIFCAVSLSGTAFASIPEQPFASIPEQPFASIPEQPFASIPKQPVDVLTSPEVIRGDFGLFNPPNSGKPLFVPAKIVPFIPNQGYGWIILLRTDKPKIKWREEFTLPEKPNTWGDPETTGSRSVSTDGLVSTTEREVSTDRGVISNAWSVAPGDPKGRYVIRVFIEDSLARVFEFDVQ